MPCLLKPPQILECSVLAGILNSWILVYVTIENLSFSFKSTFVLYLKRNTDVTLKDLEAEREIVFC